MSEFLDTFRLTDLLDIALVWLLIYLAVRSLRRPLALRLLTALTVVFLGAIMARLAGLSSLNWLLDSLIGSVVIVAVVIVRLAEDWRKKGDLPRKAEILSPSASE